jgi:hypothetical protein
MAATFTHSLLQQGVKIDGHGKAKVLSQEEIQR